MPSENSLVEGIKKYVWSRDSDAHFYRPNDARTSGVPDLFVFVRGQVLVIEAKCPASPPRNHEAPWLQHDFSPLQVAFLKKVRNAGCKGFGFVGVISTGECWVIPGSIITVRMSYDYVKNNGWPVSLEPGAEDLWRYLTA